MSDDKIASILTGIDTVDEVVQSIGDTWLPMDLTQALSGEYEEKPTMLARDDGIFLVYPGRIHEIKGEPEAGKGWFAMVLVAEQLRLGNVVPYLDFEDHEVGVVGRLVALGVDRETISKFFRYIRPGESFGNEAAAKFDDFLLNEQPSVVVLDGVTEVMVANNLNPLDNNDAAKFISMLPRRITDAGAACFLIDHVTKATDGRGRFALGAQHKLAAVDGASYKIEIVEPFGRGRKGMSRISIDKDRPGFVRQSAMNGRAIGELVVHSDADSGEVLATFRRPFGMAPDGTFVPTMLMEKVSRYLEAVVPAMPNVRLIRQAVGGKAERISQAIDCLVEGGFVSRQIIKGSHSHAHLKAFEAPINYDQDPDEDDED